ncbi:GNAT family N-acetyltransferase [Sneathiella glossodoripedis]|uniref:GNAT family N-acetyltransferase n=1 Tax=Sneathiella glossodoripedis TaxID=418853 RepID=UPI000470738B|nr:GNAT family N-acetyltransferase [Sneathiella glossodoripedis]
MIQKLEPNQLHDHLEALSILLKDCVHAGANVNFILPFSKEEAAAYWLENAAPALATHARTLWVALEGGKVAGTVQLIHKLTPNQPHRAEVTKLLVHPDYRRRGIADQLMHTLINEAKDRRKKLITLDTVTDSPAQRLYENHGFKLAGVIPDFALEPNSETLVPTSYMYLQLGLD